MQNEVLLVDKTEFALIDVMAGLVDWLLFCFDSFAVCFD